MLELFSHQNHIPGCLEDGLVSLFLPELNIKLPVREFASNDAFSIWGRGCRLQFSCWIHPAAPF
jgi:hypothetical protein